MSSPKYNGQLLVDLRIWVGKLFTTHVKPGLSTINTIIIYLTTQHSLFRHPSDIYLPFPYGTKIHDCWKIYLGQPQIQNL